MTEVDLTGSENKTFNETTIKEGYNEVNFFLNVGLMWGGRYTKILL